MCIGKRRLHPLRHLQYTRFSIDAHDRMTNERKQLLEDYDPVLGPVPSGLPSSCRQDTPDERKRGRSALSRSHRQRVAVPCSKISPAGPFGAGFGP